MSVTGADPEPFHPPVGTSDEAFPVRRGWFKLALSVLVVFLAALVVAVR